MSIVRIREIRYPTRIWKSESPDFVICSGNMRVALEVSEASDENYQALLTQTEDDECSELASDDGFVGTIPESEWAVAVVDAIRRKINKSKKYSSADRYDILVYSNHPTDAVRDATKSFEVLVSALGREQQLIPPGLPVGRVSVIDGRFLMFDVMGTPRLLPLIDMLRWKLSTQTDRVRRRSMLRSRFFHQGKFCG